MDHYLAGLRELISFPVITPHPSKKKNKVNYYNRNEEREMHEGQWGSGERKRNEKKGKNKDLGEIEGK